MKTFHIYTDASCKYNKQAVGGIVIVENNTILETLNVQFGKQIKHFDADKIEYRTLRSGYRYIIKNYIFNKLIFYCDNINAIKKFKSNFGDVNFLEVNYIKSHFPKGTINNKFNCLADWIARNNTTDINKVNNHFNYLLNL